MDAVINDVLERMDDVIDQVGNRLPSIFPESVAGPVFAGMVAARERLARSREG